MLKFQFHGNFHRKRDLAMKTNLNNWFLFWYHCHASACPYSFPNLIMFKLCLVLTLDRLSLLWLQSCIESCSGESAAHESWGHLAFSCPQKIWNSIRVIISRAVLKDTNTKSSFYPGAKALPQTQKFLNYFEMYNVI